MKKRILSILLASAMVFSLAACGSGVAPTLTTLVVFFFLEVFLIFANAPSTKIKEKESKNNKIHISKGFPQSAKALLKTFATKFHKIHK